MKAHDLDWRAGDVSTGSWTGRPFASQFTPTGNERPPRGLVSFYLDTGNSGNYDRKNTAQRMGIFNNVLWTFFPPSIAIIYGIIWMIVDGEVKRLEKFRQLSRPEGCKGASSVCLDYHCFWAPLAVFQAIRHRQWAVVGSSIGYTLALLAIPNIQNYMFVWVIFSGGYFDWGAEYSWQTGQLDPYWAKVLLGVLAINLVCALCLFPFLKFPGSKMTTELSGIMTVAELVCDKVPPDFGLDPSHDKASFNDIASVLWNQQFRLVEANSSTRLESNRGPTSATSSSVLSLTIPSRQAQNSRFRRAFNASRRCWNVFRLKLIGYCREVEKWMNGSPYPCLLRPLPLTLWIIFLALVFAANCYVVHNMTTSEQLSDQNYALPWNPSLYIATGVFIQVSSLENFLVLELLDN